MRGTMGSLRDDAQDTLATHISARKWPGAREWFFFLKKCRAAQSASLSLFWEQQNQGCRKAVLGVGLDQGHPVTPTPQTVPDASGPSAGARWHSVHRASICPSAFHFTYFVGKR